MSIKKTGQEGLFLWLQARTSGYNGVNVVDFTKSWENGLAFCALIHSFYPDLIPFDTLKPENKAENLKLAFDTADKLGVPALMDPEDMLMDCGPDKFSVITYISQYFHKFKNFGQEGSNEVTITKPAPPRNLEDEMMKKRQQIEQERMLLKKCAKCGNGFPNGGTIIDALGKQYHPECFVCFSCNKAFKDNKFVNVEGNPYCQPCAKDKFTSKAINSPNDPYDNPPCFKCKKLCEGDTINALGHSWHPECFACTTCNKIFSSGASKVLNVDGYPYCEQCGRRAFVSRRPMTSPTPAQGMSKSKSMSAIPKMAETPGENLPTATSPTPSKPLLGGSNLSVTARLSAFQQKPDDSGPKKPEPGRLKESMAQKKQEEEQKKKKDEEEKEAKRLEDEKQKDDVKKRKEDEKTKKKQEEEDKKRKEQEDKEAKKKQEEELKQKRADEVKKKKADEEAKKKKEQEEEEEKKREKQEQIKRQRADSIAKKTELDEIKKKEEEDKKRKEKDEDEARKEALRKKREDMKLKEAEEEKKREEASNKRSSVRFLHRSITETFVAHNKLAEVGGATTAKLPSVGSGSSNPVSPNNSRPTTPVSTPRDNSTSVSTPRENSISNSGSNSFTLLTTPRDSSSSTSSNAAPTSSITATLAPSTPRETSHATPTVTLTAPISLSHSASASTIHTTLVATPRTTSPAPSSAAEKILRPQVGNKIACPAADVMCGWTATSESSVQSHTATCPFFQLRPVLLKLLQSNDDLTKKVELLQTQQERNKETIASLQAKLGR